MKPKVIINDHMYQLHYSQNNPFITITPKDDNTVNSLNNWVLENREFLKAKIAIVGGVFFKGFDLNCAEDFDLIARSIEPNLCNSHDFDDSARMWFTQNIYEASPADITADPLPVAYHNEDAFMPYIPSTIMFCSIKPAEFGGESLFADSRKVFTSLPVKLQQKFLGRKIKNSFTFSDAIFLVNTRIPKNIKAITNLAIKYGAKNVYRASNSSTRFTFETPAIIKCDESTAPIWFGRAHQADLLPTIVDIKYAYQYRNNLYSTLKSYYLILKIISVHYWQSIKKIWTPETQRVTYSYENGDTISILDQIQIRQAYWKNATIVPLDKGDTIILDNRLIKHGRMPYRGTRKLLSCIGSQVMVQEYQKNEYHH